MNDDVESVRLHICRPAEYLARRVMRCPNCDRRRRFVVALYAWYPPTVRCCACGDTYGEGGRQPRPFRRGWRADAIRKARADWARAGSWTDAVAALVADEIEDGLIPHPKSTAAEYVPHLVTVDVVGDVL